VRSLGGKRNALAWFSTVACLCMAPVFGWWAFMEPASAMSQAGIFGTLAGALTGMKHIANRGETARPSGWVPEGLRPSKPAEFARAMVDELEDGDA